MKLKAFAVKKSRIEMMPLIDSFFLILVYFIYAFLSMSVHKGIPLTLPQASTAVKEDVPQYVAVSINPEGEIFLDKSLVERMELKARVNDLYLKSPEDFNLYIFGDEKAAHGDVVFVLNMAKELGIEHVSIETLPKGYKNE